MLIEGLAAELPNLCVKHGLLQVGNLQLVVEVFLVCLLKAMH